MSEDNVDNPSGGESDKQPVLDVSLVTGFIDGLIDMDDHGPGETISRDLLNEAERKRIEVAKTARTQDDIDRFKEFAENPLTLIAPLPRQTLDPFEEHGPGVIYTIRVEDYPHPDPSQPRQTEDYEIAIYHEGLTAATRHVDIEDQNSPEQAAAKHLCKAEDPRVRQMGANMLAEHIFVTQANSKVQNRQAQDELGLSAITQQYEINTLLATLQGSKVDDTPFRF